MPPAARRAILLNYKLKIKNKKLKIQNGSGALRAILDAFGEKIK